MKQKEILFFESIILFLIGAFIYMGIEIGYRGYSHWTMGVVGGLCFFIVGLLNEGYNWEMPFLKQVGIGTCVVTAVEFVAGVILNIILRLNIWDYSNIPFNLYGQICLPFCIVWAFLVAIAIVLDDYIRYKVFNEEKPRYYF